MHGQSHGMHCGQPAERVDEVVTRWVCSTHAASIRTVTHARAASRVDTLAMVRDVLHARSQDATPPTLADMVEWLDAEIRRGQS